MASIDVSKKIIDVGITVENSVLLPDAFNTIGFITRNDSSPRTLIVNKLEDLLNNGFTRDSKAYNFCYGVFLQGRLNNIVIRSVKTGEDYYDAYNLGNNSSYYFTVIDSKNAEDVLNLADKISGDLKLIFFSSNQDYSSKFSNLSNVVFYYNTNIDIEEIDGWLLFDDSSFVLLDNSNTIASESDSINIPNQISCVGAINTAKLFYTSPYLDTSKYLLRFKKDGIQYDMSIDYSIDGSKGVKTTVKNNVSNQNETIDNLRFSWSGYRSDLSLTITNSSTVDLRISDIYFGETTDVDITENLDNKNNNNTTDRSEVYGKTTISDSSNPCTLVSRSVNNGLDVFATCLSPMKSLPYKNPDNTVCDYVSGRDSIQFLSPESSNPAYIELLIHTQEKNTGNTSTDFYRDYSDSGLYDLIQNSDLISFLSKYNANCLISDDGQLQVTFSIQLLENENFTAKSIEIHLASNDGFKISGNNYPVVISSDGKNLYSCLAIHED